MMQGLVCGTQTSRVFPLTGEIANFPRGGGFFPPFPKRTLFVCRGPRRWSDKSPKGDSPRLGHY